MKLICCVLVLFSSLIGVAQCPSSEIMLNSQAEVDDFAVQFPTCTQVVNGIVISGADIVDLTPLSGLTLIENTGTGSGLVIQNNPLLTNLDGLENIADVVGFVYVENNPQLVNIDGLSGLTGFLSGWSIIIRDNPLLENLNGLANVSYPGDDDLIIDNNDSLVDLSGLENMEGADDMQIWNNDALLSLDGLDSFVLTGDFWLRKNNAMEEISGVNPDLLCSSLLIEDNNQLTNLEGLEFITIDEFGRLTFENNPLLGSCSYSGICLRIDGDLSEVIITNNTTGCNSISEVESNCSTPCPTGVVVLNSQADIDAFAANYPGCTQLVGELMILDTEISNLNGLSVLESVGSLTIAFTTNLTNTSGLQGLDLTGATPKISIDNNSGLTSIENLISSATNPSSVLITNNASLLSLDGLSGIPQLDSFAVINNAALTNLNGLEDVLGIAASSTGFIEITNNNQLQSLDGMSNVSFSGTENFITIGGNPQLTSLSGWMANGSIVQEIMVASNDVLTSLDGLEGTSGSSTLEQLILTNNPLLTDISSLANTDLMEPTTLIIEGNSILSVCNILSICNYLEGGGAATISDNASGCNSVLEVEKACLLAVDDLDIEMHISIVPNPVTTTLTIETNDGAILTNVGVYSYSGKLIHNSIHKVLDFSNLSSGVYFVKVSTNRDSFIRKIVKE